MKVHALRESKIILVCMNPTTTCWRYSSRYDNHILKFIIKGSGGNATRIEEEEEEEEEEGLFNVSVVVNTIV